MTLRVAADGAYERLKEALSFSPAAGGTAKVLRMPLLEAFRRAKEWDVAEVSLAKYCALRSSGDGRFMAVPVFPLAKPCHPMIYVHRRIAGPHDLAGRRIGIPDWSNTAAVYARGILSREFGLDLRAIEWVQAGLNEPGLNEFMTMPSGFPCQVIADRSLNDMLVSGEIDAVISPRRPKCMTDGAADVVTLFPGTGAVEGERGRPQILPVLHTFVFRTELKSRFPGLAATVVNMLSDASRSADQAPDTTWRLGLEQNRDTLEAFLTYADELGVTCGRLSVSRLFEGG